MPSAPQLDRNVTSWHSTRRHIRTIILSTALIATICAIAAPKTSAQDLGEIARQERAKKQNNPAPPATHVYTNEDLRRQQILTPEDQSRFSATTQPATIAPPESAIQLASELTPSQAPPNTMQPNISPAHTTSAKINSARPTQPTTRAKLSVSSATNANSISVQTTQPTPTSISNVAPAQPIAQVPEAQIGVSIRVAEITAQFDDAPISTTVPQNEMPLGDVARYYRRIKRQSARANAQIDPGPANAPSTAALATTIPTAIVLDQMSLGDVARYYRAKQREEAEEVAATQAQPSATPANPIAPISKYPLMLNAMPLASLKPPPTRALKSGPSRIVPTPHRPIVHSASSARQATLVNVASGDTLWQLARKYLGSGTRWTELLALNPTIQNPKRLQVGTQLALPQ